VASWKKVRLGEIVQINPESLTKQFPFQMIDYIDISSVGTGELRETSQYLIHEAPSRAKRLVRAGDTILSTVRPNRRSFLFLKNPKENQVVSTGFAVLRPTEHIHPRYVYYLISNQSFTDYLVSQEQGAAYPAVSMDSIKNALVLLPDMRTQEKIADILGTIDDKIELNIKINKTIDETIMTLYKYWFIEFGPFKDRGFEVSELGMIPKGWKAGTLGEVIELQNGYAFKSKEWKREGIPVIKIKNIVPPFINKEDAAYVDPSLFHQLDRFKITQGDLLIGLTGAEIGKCGIYYFEEPALLNQRVGKFYSSVHEMNTLPFVYAMTRLPDFRQKILDRSTGSAQPNVSADEIKKMKIVLPPDDILKEFIRFISNYYAMMIQNANENDRLKKLQNALLPRLLSGEMDVLDAEKHVANML